MSAKKTSKKDLIEKSIRLFNKRGYWGVSIKDIAESVGISQSSIYNYFQSKDYLAAACVDKVCQNLCDEVLVSAPFVFLFDFEISKEDGPETFDSLLRNRRIVNKYLKEHLSWWLGEVGGYVSYES